MPTVLAVDTSAKSVSCAVVRDQRVLASAYANTGLTHSQTLMPMIQNMLQTATITIKQIDALAVNAGPGSFTGVRIGVSAVKGMAFTEGLPCVSVSTLESMAETVGVLPGTVICGVMDARCQQVYSALFSINEDGCCIRLTEDTALSISDLCEQLKMLKSPIVLVGDGSELCYKAMCDAVPDLHLASSAIRYQSAVGAALVAERRLAAGETMAASELLPVYLRLPQAERELKAKQNV